MKALGTAIRDQRIRLGLTQEGLADRMAGLGDENIRQSDISRIENGLVQLPRFERLTYLTEALELSLGELLVNAGWAQKEPFPRPAEERTDEPQPDTSSDN